MNNKLTEESNEEETPTESVEPQEPEVEQQEPEIEQQEPESEQQEPEVERQEPEIEQQEPENEQQKPEVEQQKPDGEQQEPDKDEEIRVGVFICHCGSNIAGWVEVEKVEDYVKTLKYVVHVERNLYTCADDGLSSIRNSIKDHNLNRVIVASCTPRTHAPLFKRTCQDAGLNPYLFEFVNIREHCSWVHMKEREKATEKAMDLIRMGVARAILLEPQIEEEIEVIPSALIIGAGIAGMTAAASLANLGFKINLIEKKDVIGGMLNDLYKLYPNMVDSSEAIADLKKNIENNENITVYTSTEMIDLEGYIGNYQATIRTGNSCNRCRCL
jgi:heterodisulfide reductase subunit A